MLIDTTGTMIAGFAMTGRLNQSITSGKPNPGPNPNSTKVITPGRLDRWISYLLDNLHVKLGDKVYRQIKGVPMGTSSSPFLANLLLFMYEFRFMRRAITTWDATPRTHSHKLLTQLSLCSWYIHDLWNPLIGAGQFQTFVTQIYPSWLKVEDPEHQGPAVPYLDITITHDTSG